MGSKSITISDEAYNYLKSIKGKRSFSEVVLSLKSSSAEIMQFAGALRNTDFSSIERLREEANNEWHHRN